jgi:hypothetical protein
MNLSARATVIAAAVCASAGLAAGTAAATPLTPAQAAAAENAAAQEQVPFALPLGGAARELTGSTASTTGVEGALPAAPVLPPSSQTAQSGAPAVQDPQLVPEPLVPALDTTRKTPDLNVSAPLAPPLSGPDSGAKPNAVDLSLPSAPMRTVGSAVSLGHPLTYHSGAGRGMTPDHGAIDLGNLNPQVSDPQLHTDPRGRLDLDQGGNRKPLTQGVDELIKSAGALTQGLQQH